MKIARYIGFAAVLAMVLTGDTAAGGEDVPTSIQGTGLDTAAWLFDKYGIAGVGAFIAWLMRGSMRDFKGIPLSIEVRIVQPGPEKRSEKE